MSFDAAFSSTVCPSCHNAIPMDDVNVSTDIVLCRRCRKTFKFSELVELSTSTVDLNKPPAGAWYRQHSDGFTIGASTRSPLMLIFLVPFSLVWCGGAIGGIYGRQIMNGKFDLFTSLFGIPFLLGAIMLVSMVAMAAVGKVEIRRRGNRGEAFTGVGAIGWTRPFSWPDMRTIREDLSFSSWNNNFRNRQKVIILEGRTRIACGGGLSESRRFFLLDGLRR
jgi:hypothetical protein